MSCAGNSIISYRMIASRTYCREPAVDTIGEIEDTNDEKDVDLRQLAKSLNKVINVLAIQTDRINFQHSETNQEKSKNISEQKQQPSDDLSSGDSISCDSIQPPQAVTVDVHHTDIGQKRRLKDHIDVEYEGVVVSRFNLTKANVTKINTLLSTYSLKKEEETNNEEPGTKPTSIIKNIHLNNQNDMIDKAPDKTVKKHKRNVNFTSQGSSDLVPHQLAEAKNPFLTQDKQDVETQTDQGDGKEGCGMM
eukprot:TRINITY_DN32224_c0_g1_i1.p1 TRINITY_DN32224_c0_g1~~TRINITY_DN32224_c0_g1_i1.p1  ORF type:complete len:249 (-),score=62.90 TRINITY_DN32224_c0_g1_i1:275-1021(-)